MNQKRSQRGQNKLRKKYDTIRRCTAYCDEENIIMAFGNLTDNGYKNIEVKHSNGKSYKVVGYKTL